MCADGAKPAAERFGYKNAIEGIVRIARENGIGTFSRGLIPNIVRSVLMNVSQIATSVSNKPSVTQLQLANYSPQIRSGKDAIAFAWSAWSQRRCQDSRACLIDCWYRNDCRMFAGRCCEESPAKRRQCQRTATGMDCEWTRTRSLV